MNPYKINEPAAISFSGGRTSAYMLHRIIDANDGLSDNHRITFANTGKEMPQTLDFVQRCSDEWQVPITWLECRAQLNPGEGNKYLYETRVVDYATASRRGEPFMSLIKARNYLPNVVARFCTQELKVLRIRDWMNLQFDRLSWVNVIGLRYDEPRRTAKMAQRDDVLLPLVADRVDKWAVGAFWDAQTFDLELPNNSGVTDWGNCDLCFLKGGRKKQSIINQRPDLAAWWIDQEQLVDDYFRADQPSYAQMLANSESQLKLLDDDLEGSISCFCGD